MSLHRDTLYLKYIKDCLERILTYVEGGEAFFLKDVKTQDAVLRNLHTLCESAQKLSAGTKEKAPNIDWRALIRFRNVVVHNYLGIDLKQIWKVVSEDLPPLQKAVKILLEQS